MLKRIGGPTREEIAGGCRRLNNEELHNLYSSFHFIRMTKSRRRRWARYVVGTVGIRIAYKILVGKPDGKIPFRVPRRKWEDNIKRDLD
jgi:hypothetical protein